MLRLLPLLFLVPLAVGEEEPPKTPAAPKIDVGAILRKSPDFKKKLKKFKISYDHEKGIVRSVGEIAYRSGGPCEFLINVFPAKSHETVVLLDDGPWDGPGRRDARALRGLATTLNNAFLAAGFPRGKPFDWDRDTGEVFMPKGVPVWIYCEFEEKKEGSKEPPKKRRALMSEWLWNYKTLRVMAPKKFLYTGSLMIDLGPPNHEKAFGAELDRLLVAVLNTQTALIDTIEEGSLDNGAFEGLHQRIPPIGTRVTVVYSLKKLPATKHEPLELSKELLAERARRDAERAREKAQGGKEKATGYRPPEGVGQPRKSDKADKSEDSGDDPKKGKDGS